MKFRADPDRLRALMAERGLTCSALAEKANCDHKTIARALRGDEIIVTTAARIQRALGAIPPVDGPSLA